MGVTRKKPLVGVKGLDELITQAGLDPEVADKLRKANTEAGTTVRSPGNGASAPTDHPSTQF